MPRLTMVYVCDILLEPTVIRQQVEVFLLLITDAFKARRDSRDHAVPLRIRVHIYKQTFYEDTSL